ncbi:MAG: D-alanyl-D-alanine carboxypeptidase [Lachnospiraceae bacterium]|nr:D-alanyl-D-alanine carboxypeptidase [Lachnospiraceae bacterium]
MLKKSGRKNVRTGGICGGKKTKCILAVVCVLLLTVGLFPVQKTAAEELTLTSEAYVLMEGSTGEILCEKDATKQLRPASITKIMTLLLIFEAVESGKISLTDEVSVSEHAASMGGSQVYLEPYEKQPVETMIKCISIASANDASVAMAEFIAGSEEAFVAQMNERAAQLGMENTHFVNCYGLDTDGHYSCALDVAKMSRELIMNHPEISNYSTVWMDTFVHTTSRGQTEFGLTNTNKLIKSYQGITGLKTGSTGLAKYCLSATARRDDMNLIAVIMAAPDTKTRFKEAAELLNYGFANYQLYRYDFSGDTIARVPVKSGVEKEIALIPQQEFSKLFGKDVKKDAVELVFTYEKELFAPVEAGTPAGRATFLYEGKELGSVELVTADSVAKAKYSDILLSVWKQYFKR